MFDCDWLVSDRNYRNLQCVSDKLTSNNIHVLLTKQNQQNTALSPSRSVGQLSQEWMSQLGVEINKAVNEGPGLGWQETTAASCNVVDNNQHN